MSHSSYKISVKGLNLHHVITYFEKEKILLSEVERSSPKNLTFIIDSKDYKRFKKSNIHKAYKIRILKRYGFENYYRFILSKIGLFSGIIIFALTCLNITNRIHNVKIISKDHICQNQQQCIHSKENKELVLSAIRELGIYENAKISSLPLSKTVKQNLMLKFNQIADVSIYRNGVNYYIEILEAKLPIQQTTHNIIAPENGIIISTDCTSGTLKVKNGDIVIKGQVLVEANNIPACAKIILRSFYHDTYIFNETQTTYKRTGKKHYVNNLSFFGINLKSNTKSSFQLYETETLSKYAFLNHFLPIKINTTIYYELKQTDITQIFEEQKDKIYADLEQKIIQTIPLNTEIKNTTYSVIKEGSRYRVDCYIETYLTIEK